MKTHCQIYNCTEEHAKELVPFLSRCSCLTVRFSRGRAGFAGRVNIVSLFFEQHAVHAGGFTVFFLQMICFLKQSKA